MRLSPLLALFGASVLTHAKENVAKKPPTVFNGVEVPPLLELNPKSFKTDLNTTKFTMVKFYRYEPPPIARQSKVQILTSSRVP